MHYYRHDLALIHDRGQGQHADRCAPGILELLAPLVPGGLVLELGCGSGALTRHPAASRWRRDSEHHENVLADTSGLPALLREHGVTATAGSSFGAEELPTGMVAVTGTRSWPGSYASSAEWPGCSEHRPLTPHPDGDGAE